MNPSSADVAAKRKGAEMNITVEQDGRTWLVKMNGITVAKIWSRTREFADRVADQIRSTGYVEVWD